MRYSNIGLILKEVKIRLQLQHIKSIRKLKVAITCANQSLTTCTKPNPKH